MKKRTPAKRFGSFWMTPFGGRDFGDLAPTSERTIAANGLVPVEGEEGDLSGHVESRKLNSFFSRVELGFDSFLSISFEHEKSDF